MKKSEKILLEVIPRLSKYIGVAIIIWLFGILIFCPLANFIPSTKSFVSLIVIIPIALLFFRAIRDMVTFSKITGNALFSKNKNIKDSRPYVNLFYALWIIIAIILFAPLIYNIHNVFGGIFLFIAILTLFFLFFINLKYVLVLFITYIFPPNF